VQNLEVVVRIQAVVVVPDQADEGDGAARVRVAGPASGETDWVGRREQDTLELSGSHRWVALDVERGHAADHGGRHRGAAQLDVLGADHEGRIVQRKAAVRGEGGDDAPSRGHEVRLAEAVLRDAVAGEAGQRVVRSGGGALVVARTNADHVGVIRGGIQRAIGAAVAGGHYPDAALQPGVAGHRGAVTISVVDTGDIDVEVLADDHAAGYVGMGRDAAVNDGDPDPTPGQGRQGI